MDNVVELFGEVPPSKAICRACKHEFEIAVTDDIDFYFNCPSCNENKAVFKNVFGANEGEFEYKCGLCDSHDFFIWKRSIDAQGEIRCRGCGSEIVGWF